MEYKVNTSLYNFPAYGGAIDTLDVLKERNDWEEVEFFLESIFLEEDITDGDINDFLWFERDAIAEHLGYSDWDAYETNADPTADDYTDQNGTPIYVGDKVIWHDEAGVDEDGTDITFFVVADNGDGYYNLGLSKDDETAERWAWCDELEVLE